MENKIDEKMFFKLVVNGLRALNSGIKIEILYTDYPVSTRNAILGRINAIRAERLRFAHELRW